MTRHVIKNAAGAYFTHVDIVGRKAVIETDGSGEVHAIKRPLIAPAFHAFTASQASKYGTAQDAADMMAHPHLADANAFAGCTVETTES
jgi:hypothetical protein